MCAWLQILRVRRWVLAVVYDGIDESFGEDNGLDLSSQRFLKDVVLGQMDSLIGVVGRIEFWLGRKEDIIRDAGCRDRYLLNANSYLGDLYDSDVTFCTIFC